MQGDDMTVMDRTQDMFTWAREYATQLDAGVRRVLRERPLLALFGAAAFGCLAGRIMSRR